MATNYPIVKSTFEGYPLTPLQHANTRVSAEQGDVIHKAGEELSWTITGFTVTIYTGMITCGGYVGEITAPVTITLVPGAFNTIYMETNLSTGEMLIGHEFAFSPIVLTAQELVTYGTGLRQIPLLEFYCSDTKPDYVQDWMPKYRTSNRDTGWKDAPLTSSVFESTSTGSNTATRPQYRIKDGILMLRGIFCKSDNTAFGLGYISVFHCADAVPYLQHSTRDVTFDTVVLLPSSTGKTGLRGYFDSTGMFRVASANNTNHPTYCAMNASINLYSYTPIQEAL